MANSKQYLVDSGSAFSILPHKSSAEPTGPRPMTADGKLLHCWGRCTCSVCTMTREFSWTFLLAPVAFPILGADFLSNFRLLVDISNKRRHVVASSSSWSRASGPRWLWRLEWWQRPRRRQCSPLLLHFPQWRHPAAASQGHQRPAGTQGQPGSPRWWQQPAAGGGPSTPSLPIVEAPSSSFSGPPEADQHIGEAKKLLLKYKAVVGATKRLPPVKHAVEYLIETTGTQPVASCYHRLDPEQRPPTRQSLSPWSPRASFIAPRAAGHHRCTWWRSSMAPGSPAARVGHPFFSKEHSVLSVLFRSL